jgi:hypothetical protein
MHRIFTAVVFLCSLLFALCCLLSVVCNQRLSAVTPLWDAFSQVAFFEKVFLSQHGAISHL